MQKNDKPSYPGQQQQQQQPYPPMQPQHYPPMQGQYPPQGPPPPYYYQPQQQPQYYPQASYQQQPHYPYPSGTVAPPQYSMPSTGTTVVVQGAFDPGARFSGVSQPNIPPPPPGCMPNAAQMAAMQGHTVVGTQRRDNNFFWGETGGGWTW